MVPYMRAISFAALTEAMLDPTLTQAYLLNRSLCLMVRFALRCLPFLLLAFLLAACGSNNVALQGRVLDAYTNEPIEGALLRVGNRSGITTDANGSYTTNAWNAEETLTAEAAGY